MSDQQECQERDVDLEPMVAQIRETQPSLVERLEEYRAQRRAYEALRARRVRMPRPAVTGGREYHV